MGACFFSPLSSLFSLLIFLTAVLFFTPSVSHPPSVLLFLHAALFSLIALHLFLYPPTLHTDTAEGISLSHSVSLSLLSLSPPSSVSVFLLICLPLSLALPLTVCQ